MTDDTVAYGTFGEHLEELRRTLIRMLIVIGIGFGISLLFYSQIFEFLTLPLKNSRNISEKSVERQILKRERILNSDNHSIYYTIPDHNYLLSGYSDGTQLISKNVFLIPSKGYIDIDIPENKENLLILSPTEGIITLVKTCLWTGLIATSPLWLYYLAQFISPALRQEEKGLLFSFIFYSLLFLSIGVMFGFFVTIPISNQYLYTLNDSIGINFWTLSHYLDYTVFLMLANGLAFECCVIVFFLIRLNLLKAKTMIAYQRHMIIFALVLGALLTPPDIFTQVMLAIPLIAMYELLILYALLRDRIRSQKEKEVLDGI